MKRISLIALLLSAFTSQSVCAGKIVFMPEAGVGDVALEEEFRFTEAAGSEGGLVAGVVAGYKFDSNFILLGNYSLTDTDWLFGAFDHYSIFEIGILIGYSIDLADRFRVVPAIGLSAWDLEVEQGEFLNPGAEGRHDFNGTDVYGRLNFEMPFNDLVQLNASYVYGKYDFGTLSSTRVGLKFEF